jgi:regulator of RNase E activity RraA
VIINLNQSMKIFLIVISALTLMVSTLSSQTISRDEMIFLTAKWEGERFEDGRPKVADGILERMKLVSTEEAWGVLRGEGYHNQFDGGWKMIHDEMPIVGRALTAQYMPNRPDVNDQIKDRGKAAGRIGGTNSWPIDMLTMGDVYVADGYGKVKDGTLIGDNLGNAIYAKSGNGVIFDGSARDLEGLKAIDGFNAFVRDWHPSYIQEMMLLGINIPIRVGEAIVLPGDIVLARSEGVLFVPAHLAEKVVTTSEVVRLRDMFGHSRLKEGKYTPGEIDRKWTDEIEKDFSGWLKDHIDELPVPKEEIQKLLEKRTW